MNSISANLLKWWQTIKVTWVKYTAYKMNFFLTIIGPSLVFLFVKYNLWNAIYDIKGDTSIEGYNLKQMIEYHLWGFLIILIAQGHASWNLSDDIRLGRISTYLIYPFNFWEFHTASFLSFQILQLFIATFSFIMMFSLGFIETLPPTQTMISGVLFSTFVSFFWYVMQYFTGVLAFWLDETWIMRVMLSIVTSFLSGSIIPLDLYPKWFVEILSYSPFPYLTYYPIQIFTGKAVLEIQAIGIVSFWMIVVIGLNAFVWKRGMRLYTAAGM